MVWPSRDAGTERRPRLPCPDATPPRTRRRAAILVALGLLVLAVGLILALAATPDSMPILDKLALRQSARAVARELPDALTTPGPARTVLGVGTALLAVGLVAAWRK